MTSYLLLAYHFCPYSKQSELENAGEEDTYVAEMLVQFCLVNILPVYDYRITLCVQSTMFLLCSCYSAYLLCESGDCVGFTIFVGVEAIRLFTIVVTMTWIV